jgi:hypothetical protein
MKLRLFPVVLVLAGLAGLVGVACGGAEKATTPPSPAMSPWPTVVQPTTTAEGTPAGPVPTTPGTPAQPGQGVASVVIDVDPSTPEVDVGPRTFAVGDTIAVDVVVLSSPMAYNAYQYQLSWNTSVLEFREEKGVSPELEMCLTTVRPMPDSVYGACLNPKASVTYTGPVSEVTFVCVGTGESDLHLVGSLEDNQFFTALGAEAGIPIPTALQDASVKCE